MEKVYLTESLIRETDLYIYMDVPSESKVFVRLTNQWLEARPYQIQAYENFLQQGVDQAKMCIPHPNGGEFVAIFKRETDSVDRFTTESGNVIEITHLTPGKAAYINRIMDHNL